MDEATMWLANERVTEARQRAAEHRRGASAHGPLGRRPLLERLRRVR